MNLSLCCVQIISINNSIKYICPFSPLHTINPLHTMEKRLIHAIILILITTSYFK